MVSKAWYKSAAPRLIGKFTNTSSSRKKAVEIWTTTCILTNFGKQCRHNSENISNDHQQQPVMTLINPANPNLSGPNAFPYFPRGGPQPKVQPNRHAHHIMGYVSQWGGMDVGNGMLFSAESIDGLLHQLGGLRFRAECNLVPPHPWADAYFNQQQQRPKSAAAHDGQKTNDTVEVSNIVNAPNPNTKCPVGTAVSTPAVGGELQSHYDRIIHTVPPFYNYPPTMTKEVKRLLRIDIEESEEDLHHLSKEFLHACYRQSFHVAFGSNNDKDQGYSLWNNPIASMLGFGKYRHNQQSICSQRVAVPLLGAGCRDFPKNVALEVAALESASWLLSNSKKDARATDAESSPKEELVVAFGLLESVDAEALTSSIEQTIQLSDAEALASSIEENN
eukprot:CAMPEP_0201691350 /NCGR_PEP_ID=MMETSP0578-20130828/4526_1 /ASSEMBLY_ACC=CAM_ASM_000663 /TAXON_ID=267565 /ORGANISM="Skeletonema grethea, Strain CCMP 1804" /LENGTH=390 /DNA_ID=CAMNT_0048176533 /DNA_START=115 /DNA_END=1287 /DNA_ORIENTATION=+